MKPSKVHFLLCYKNFAAHQNISHIGLGVAALNTAKVLKAHGLACDVLAASSAIDIARRLTKDPTITHVVVSAPWISPTDFSSFLLCPFPRIEFAVNVHSNVGFLQADPNGVELILKYVALEQGNMNFRISANSKKGVRWLRGAEQSPCAYLPNLYFLDSSLHSHRPIWDGGLLNIGMFGAQRPLKNLMSAVGAALLIANLLKAETRVYMNSGRAEGGGNTVVNAIRALLKNRRNIQLIEIGWDSWSGFRDAVRTMHLLISVSYTESFNMVTADGVAEGVPSVVSDAIEWTPEYWKAPVDQTNEIARIGRQLIRDPNAAHDGVTALEQHNKDGFGAWCQFANIAVAYKSVLIDPYLI